MVQTTDFVATLFDEKNDPNKVTVSFTMGLNALEKGFSATVILMVDAVHLGKPGATDGLDIGEPFMPVSDVLAAFLEKGGQVAVCKSCMLHNGLQEDDMDPRYTIITAPEVIDLTMAAKGSLQVT